MAHIKRLTRRNFLKISAGTASVMALTACTPAAVPAVTGQSSDGSDVELETPTVQLATWTAAANLPVWQEAIDSFQEKNPDISVTMEHTPSDAYWDKLTVSYAGGTAPDIIYAPPDQAQRTGSQGMLLELTPYIEKDGLNLEDINPPSQRPFIWDDKVWAICAWNDTRYMIYNKTLFKEAGLPDLPEEWDGEFSMDQFLEYALALTDPDTQTWGYVFEGNTSAARWSWLFGAHYWDNQDEPTRAVMDSPEGIRGLQFVQDMVYTHKVAPSTAENVGGSDPMFQTGKVGMIWAGFKSAAAVHAEITEFEWGISTIPKEVERTSIISPQSFAIISKSQVPDAAWAVVKYFTFEDGNVILTQLTSMPANRNVDFSAVSPLEPWQNQLLQDALRTGRTEIPHPNVKPQMITVINEEMDQLMANLKTGEEVAIAMASRINEIFDSAA